MIVVTGASRGLGRAICERLISRGSQVVGLARTVGDGPYREIKCDVSSAADVKRVAQILKGEGIEVEGLINAAGIASMNLGVLTPPQTVKSIIETNLLGTIYCCQNFAPMIMRRKAGAIVNFSTIAVALGLKGESIYVASKAGVEGFSRAFAREMSDFGVTVNVVAPGPIDTALLRGVSRQQVDKIVAQQIFKRQFTPDSVCDVVEILLSPKAASVTGQVLHVGGA
jgi:3-oxoacyl-[acyl-carrier protein] reductase